MSKFYLTVSGGETRCRWDFAKMEHTFDLHQDDDGFFLHMSPMLARMLVVAIEESEKHISNPNEVVALYYRTESFIYGVRDNLIAEPIYAYPEGDAVVVAMEPQYAKLVGDMMRTCIAEYSIRMN